MAAQAPPVVDERDALIAYLIQQQDGLRGAIFGLTDAQAGLTPTASKLSVGALVKHTAATQDSWVEDVEAAPELWDNGLTEEENYAAYAAQFSWTEEDTVEGAVATFDVASAKVLDAVRRFDLDTPVPVQPAPWNPPDVKWWSARWVWFHLIEELARHAGHADILRESIDGATMYELIGGREGWPETPWLKPWKRPEEA